MSMRIYHFAMVFIVIVEELCCMRDNGSTGRILSYRHKSLVK